jgi:hypothetical protein
MPKREYKILHWNIEDTTEDEEILSEGLTLEAEKGWRVVHMVSCPYKIDHGENSIGQGCDYITPVLTVLLERMNQ